MVRRVSFLLALALVLVACGDDDAATTTATTPEWTTEAATTVPESTTTTGPTDTGPLAGFLTAPVEDPFYGTGFYGMAYVDDAHSYAVSTASLTGPDPMVERLGVGLVDPTPLLTGLGDNQRVMHTWVDNWGGDIAPEAFTLFTLGPSGWENYATVTNEMVLGFLDTTTDYDARRPDGPPVLDVDVVSFDWSGTAHFVAEVVVFDLFVPETAAFAGQIECTLGDILECALLSDDGVLRPGDSGEAVQHLQTLLIALGYLSAPATGTYDTDTEDAVTAFQRDYRLTRDGKAGPHTLEVIEAIGDGTSDIVFASQFGVGTVPFNAESVAAWTALKGILGEPDSEVGWYVDGCDGHLWWKSTWAGFTAIFTDRNGSKQFDGWQVDDLSNVPSFLYFAGGLRPGSTWGYVRGLGGVYDPGYGGFFRVADFGYNNGRFVVTPPYPSDPANSAVVASFGTGTGSFVSC